MSDIGSETSKSIPENTESRGKNLLKRFSFHRQPAAVPSTLPNDSTPRIDTPITSSPTHEPLAGRPSDVVVPSALATVEAESPFHPDIEKGLEAVLKDRLPQMVQAGNIEYLSLIGNELVAGVKMQQAASGVDLEPAPGMGESLREKLDNTVRENLEQGLQSVIKDATQGASQGFDFSITNGHRKITEFFKMAKDLDVNLSRSSNEGVDDDSQMPVVLDTDESTLHALLDDKVDQVLLSGINTRIRMVGYNATSADRKGFDDDKRRLEEWIEFVGQRGFTIVDKDPGAPIEGDEEQGVIPREINRQEIARLTDTEIRSNLAKGVQKALDRTQYNVTQGMKNVGEYATDEKIGFLRDLSAQYHVIDPTLDVLIDGEKWNPDLFPQAFSQVIRDGLPAGLDMLQARHKKWLEEGDISMTTYSEDTVDTYFDLADTYGIEVDKDAIKANLQADVVPDVVQKGVQAIIANGRKWLQKGEFNLSKVAIRKADALREFIEERGLTEQVDMEPLATFLQETGLQLPQLPE